MLTRASRRGQALLIVLAFIAAFALILWATAFFASGSFLAQRSAVSDTKATYTVDATLQWGLAYVRLNPPACTSGSLTPAIPSPGPAVNGYTPTLAITPDGTCTPGAPVFNLVAAAGPRSGSAQVALKASSRPIALVQNAQTASTIGTATATFPAATTAGNFLGAFMSADNGSGTGWTFPAGWVQGVRVVAGSGSNSEDAVIYYYPNNPGGITSVRASNSGASNVSLLIAEFSGVSTTAAVDARGSGGSKGATSGTVSTSAATTAAGELAIVGWGLRDTGVEVFVESAGWTTIGNTGAGRASPSDWGYRVTGAAGVISETETWTNAVVNAGVIASFRAASATTAWTLNWYLLQ
jgi:hypothetical protein